MSNEERRIRLVTIHRHPSGKNVTGITYCLPDDSQKDPCSKNREGVSESDVMDNYFLGIMQDLSNRVASQEDIIGFDVKLDNFDKEDKEKLYNLLKENFKNQDGKPVKIIKTNNELTIITDAGNNTPSIGDDSSSSNFLAIGGLIVAAVVTFVVVKTCSKRQRPSSYPRPTKERRGIQLGKTQEEDGYSVAL